MPAVLTALESLDDLHRDCLVVLALDSARALSRSAWQDRVARAGIVDERGRKVAGEPFKAVVEGAVAAGAALLTPRHEHAFEGAWLGPVLEDAHRRRALSRIVLHLGVGERLSYSSYSSGALGAKGKLLVALVTGEGHAAAEQSFRFPMVPIQDQAGALFDTLGLDVPFGWIARLDPALRNGYLRLACHVAFMRAERLGSGVRAAALASDDPEVRARIVTLLSLIGDGERTRAALDTCEASQWERGARAFVALTEGRMSEARDLFAQAAVGSRKQRVELPAYLAVFDLLLAVTSDSAVEVADVPRRIDRAKRPLSEVLAARNALDELARFRQTGRPHDSLHDGLTWLEVMVTALRDSWMDQDGRARHQLAKHVDRAQKSGYAWLATELERIAVRHASSTLLPLLGKKEGWEMALDALVNAAEEGGARSDAGPSTGPDAATVWWTIDLHLHSTVAWMDLDAHLVTKRAAKGKRVSISRALSDPAVPLDEHDRRIADSYEARAHDYGSDRSISLLSTMIGHPRVRDIHGTHIRVELGEPTLHVTEKRDGAMLRLSPSRFDDTGMAVERPDVDRVVVYKRSAVVARVQSILAGGELHVPAAGLARMSDAIAALGTGLRVEAGQSIARDGGAGDPRPRVQIFRAGSGLRARVRVVPGGTTGPALRPGKPPAEVMVGSEDGLVRLTRDLPSETSQYGALLDRCPTLASLPQEGDDRVAADLETCLELLLDLREAEIGVVEWPEGQPLRAPSVRGTSNVRVSVRTDGTWLAIDGQMQLDESRVLEMRDLLASASRAVGRFIPIGDDEYVALTEDLRAKLDTLARVRGLGKDGRLSAALLSSMDGIFAGLDVSFAAELETKRAAFERARTLEPKTPRDLATELRDYQREGFLFLARRAEAGLGACLADDMGLGKTVQALALLLHRRKKGPALVVAPTSVCRNWEDEARRFAPSLSLHRLAQGDRAACVRGAANGDVVISSYGLLASEAELLASRTWATVIYDEAHALKNASTRRWSAARDVKGDAIVALTGTPVENHAGELHALFDLLVPGMLGTRSSFDAALGAKIANGDRAAAALLRQLVRPFALRRTKAQVLSELPPKTELLQIVSASDEHRAFYEAVRRRAVEKIEDARAAGGARAGRARIELLAEITRLRRAAIDPRLVGGEGAPEGSKLDALVELVVELREEGRRALVFSQFLEVLDLARARLEDRGVECRRLDGTMTQGTRADEVAAFQGGKGDVFLVSLKAGGIGMNLTAADVVILLDPWWNPAVEDQASSRAHRMGQSRPVTVVRIVTEGTIEEKVLAMHAKKRQLFDDVVTDADGGGTLDMDALATLLG